MFTNKSIHFGKIKYSKLLFYYRSKAATVDISRRIFQNLMIDLHVIIHSKQFELLPSYPSKSTYINKNLKALRKKMLQ
jgi:hypothetical protein